MRRLLLAITTWEWLLLFLLLPFLAFPTANSGLLLLIIPVFWLIRKAATGHFVPPTPYTPILLVLALALLVSLVVVFDIESSFPKIAGLILAIALFFAAVEHSRQYRYGPWMILGAVLLSGTFISMLAVLFARWYAQFRFLNNLISFLPPSMSALPGKAGEISLLNPNELAGVLAWVVPLLVAATLGYTQVLWRSKRAGSLLVILGLFAALLFNGFVLLASQSRGGIIATAVALLFMFALRFRWGIWLVAAGVIGGTVLALNSGSFTLLAGPPEEVLSLGLQGRLELWSRGLYALTDFPITGVGMNGFRQIVPVLYPLFTVAQDFNFGHAHNHLLQAGLDLGIPGLIAYLAIWILSAGLLWQGLRKQPGDDSRWRTMRIGLAGSLMGGWFFGILDTIALGARPGFIWWLLLALVVASTVDVMDKSEGTGSDQMAV